MNDNQQESVANAQDAVQLRQAMSDFIRELLTHQHAQPAAGELLENVEVKFGWRARHELLAVIRELRDDPDLQSFLRSYLKTALPDDAINDALRGEARWTHEGHATLDALFRRSAAHRGTAAFREMLAFTAKFRAYAPYNNFLVKLQDPSCGFDATERDWHRRFQRALKEDARPLLILAPRHPVMMVYALDSTDGAPLPKELQEFATATGDWEPESLPILVDNAKRDRIRVEFKTLSSTHAGRATTQVEGPDWKMRVMIHDGLDERSRFATLCHELAHIHLGHLGGDKDGWWPSRIGLDHDTVEIEAESVAYVVCTRIGLTPAAESYLSRYIKLGVMPAPVSPEMIFKVAGKLENLAVCRQATRTNAGA